MTYEEYKALIQKAMQMPFSPYNLDQIEALNEVTERIEVAEAAHPEYAEMLAARQ